MDFDCKFDEKSAMWNNIKGGTISSTVPVYCLIKNMVCGKWTGTNCGSTGCIKESEVGYIKVDNFDEMEKYRLARFCQICGEPTESLDDWLCDECKKRLKKLLYGDTLKTCCIKGAKEIVYTIPALNVEEKESLGE